MSRSHSSTTSEKYPAFRVILKQGENKLSANAVFPH